MSGGDFLFIFSFIILPTAILVSAIWALIAIRTGVLLPPRQVADHEYDAWDKGDVEAEEISPEPAADVAATRPQDTVTGTALATSGSLDALAEEREQQDRGSDETVVGGAAAPETSPIVETGQSVAEPDVERTLDEETAPGVATQPVLPATVQTGEGAQAVQLPSVEQHDALPETAGSNEVAGEAESRLETPASVPPTTPIPDDLEVVFVPRGPVDEVTTPIQEPAPGRERPHPTQAIAVERSQARVNTGTATDDDADRAAATHHEACGDENVDEGPRTPGSDSRRGGARKVARLRPAEEPAPRQRLLVASQPRSSRRGSRAHRRTDGGSVPQDEGIVERRDGA